MVERGIGRGLAAILPSPSLPEETLQQLPIDLIRPNPRQPRGAMDGASLRALADSINEHGLLQPVLARALPAGGYELIAGERRWRAARLAGLDTVPAVVRSSADSEQLELALVENMAREDLNPVDAARACAALVGDLGLTKEEVGRRVGKSRVAISNLIRLLDLPDEVLALLESSELTEGHGRALLQATRAETQRALARAARDKGLSVRELESLARAAEVDDSLRQRDGRQSERADAEAGRQAAEDAISAALGHDARVRLRRKGCTVEIPFEELEEVHDLAHRLRVSSSG